MVNDMVMRSVYLDPEEDLRLRQLAFNLNVTKSDLIRSAIGAKLSEWGDNRERIRKDLQHGQRPGPAERAAQAREVVSAKEKSQKPVKGAIAAPRAPASSKAPRKPDTNAERRPRQILIQSEHVMPAE